MQYLILHSEDMDIYVCGLLYKIEIVDFCLKDYQKIYENVTWRKLKECLLTNQASDLTFKQKILQLLVKRTDTTMLCICTKCLQ